MLDPGNGGPRLTALSGTVDQSYFSDGRPNQTHKLPKLILRGPWIRWVAAASLMLFTALVANFAYHPGKGEAVGSGGSARKNTHVSHRPNWSPGTIAKLEAVVPQIPSEPLSPFYSPQSPVAEQFTGAPETSCKIAEPSNELFAVSDEDTAVMQAPGNRSRPATDPWGVRRVLDPRFNLKTGHLFGDWIEVKTVSPDWPPGSAGWTGWIEKKALLVARSEDEKKCLFVDTKTWNGVTPAIQGLMRQKALRILREDARCSRIVRGGPTGSPSLYFFTCYPSDGGKQYHYWLSPDDKDSQAAFISLPLTQPNAIKKCRSGILFAYMQATMRPNVNANEILTRVVNVDSDAPVFKFTIDFRIRSEEGQEWSKAFCLVSPKGEAEVTLMGR